MNQRIPTLFTVVVIFLAFLLYLSPAVVRAITTTVTSDATVTGQNAPNATNLGHGVFAILLPLSCATLFSLLGFALGQRGNSIVTLILIGNLIGNIFGMLTFQGVNPTSIPFALVVLSILWLGLWLWRNA